MSATAQALLATILASAPAPEPPALLAKALAQNRSLAVVEPSHHYPGDYGVDQLKEWHLWPTWREADLDRDGRADVVAAVARRNGDKFSFGVMAVHASAPTRIHWVAVPQDHVIYSVAIGPARDTVVPLYCIECDSNAWYRWSHGGYHVELYAPSERIAVATYETTPLGLYQKPDRASHLFTTVPPCTPASVLRVRGDAYEERWYFIQIVKSGTRGWIPATFAAESECIG